MTKLKFPKILFSILMLTAFCLYYVHQEIEIVKTSFNINKNRKHLSFLLDQYRSLVYNLSRLESPERIENALSENEIVLCMPKTRDIRRFESENLAGNRKKEEKPSFLASVFDRFSTKAEALVVE